MNEKQISPIEIESKDILELLDSFERIENKVKKANALLNISDVKAEKEKIKDEEEIEILEI
jgi:Xaa-Pro aminopeptidase